MATMPTDGVNIQAVPI